MDPTERDSNCAWIERRLAEQTPRTPPPEWRSEILGAAMAARPSPGTGTGGWVPEFSRWLTAFRSGWTVAGAAWLLVWILHAYASLPGGDRAVHRPPFSDRLMAEQQAFQKGLVDS